MAYKYSASSRLDVSRLAMNLATTPEADWPLVLAVVHDLGLVRLAWYWRLAVWVATKRGLGRRTVYLELFKRIGDSDPSALNDAMEAVVKHCLHGRDTEDKDSVGGWSQREIDLLVGAVKFSNDGGL